MKHHLLLFFTLLTIIAACYLPGTVLPVMSAVYFSAWWVQRTVIEEIRKAALDKNREAANE